MGSTLPTSNPPIRVAEEYAMLDCISGGRLVAGLPLGSPMDVNLCYGITPLEQRERYREAFALTLKAWQAREIFAWNGRYYQLANVNLWPRPIQTPHPPVWVPGSGSVSTFDFAVEHDVCYCFLSYSGARPAKALMDGYWEVVARAREGAESVPRRVPPARRGLRDGRPRRGRVRAARRVLLPQVPPRPGPVVLAAREPGLPEPPGRRAQSDAAHGQSQGSPLP